MAAFARALLLCLCAAPYADASRGQGSGAGERRLRKGGADLQPELAAELLTKVEDGWKAEAAAFVACNASTGGGCAKSEEAFKSSCVTVVGAVLKGSSGDRNAVAEYMDDVCGEPLLRGWKRQHCQAFKQALASFMTADAYDNREHLDASRLCRGLWQRFSAEEAEERRHALEAQEKARAEAAKRAEEAAKVAAKRKEEEAKAAAEEAKKHAEQEAKHKAEEAKRKAEEERLQAEARRRKEEDEVARQAAEAKRQAEEAAKRVKAKQEEAAKEAELAKRKMEEAQAAVKKVHQYHSRKSDSNASEAATPVNSTNASSAAPPAARLATEVAVVKSTNATAVPSKGTRK
mmetsp:Transcript_12890/g.40695  ORF Transcript_12890/g.40695 Transcript_12890/m.40695 type:complete len:347 (-) Transcript_12890:21-1061(-)